MKRFSIIFSWLISFSIALSAAPRTVTAAMELAQTFLSEQGQQWQKAPQSHTGGVSSAQALTLSHTQMLRDNSTPAVYVFNHAEGFVWVSADDNAKPVLGYSDAGVFNPSDIPANVRFWLDMYAHEIERAAANPQPRKAKASATYTPVTPLCSATWNQGSPFNNLCPLKNGERTVTGCVATAAAQVMYANRYPTQGTGSHSYTWNGQTLRADFGSTTYAWNDMQDSYNGSYTTTQANAVATLMYHCGVACEMEYDLSANGGSGAITAQMASALVTYFGYDAGINALPKDYIDPEEMLQQMASDLAAGHAILMSGRTKNDEGHAFVCDGIRSDGYLHINWGWGGACDGYFALSALDPENQGIGGAVSGDAFTENVTAFTNIKPNAGGKERVTVTAANITWTSGNTLSQSEPVYFQIDDFTNEGICTMNGYYAFDIQKDDGATYHFISNYAGSLSAGYYFKESQSTSVDLSNLPDGNYELSIGISQNETYYPFLVAGAGEKRFAFSIANGTISYNTAAETTDITIRIRKAANCTMNTANGLWIWWWDGTTSTCTPTTYADGWYTATVSAAAAPIGCLVVNQDVTGNNWSGAAQTSDYTGITSDICLEIGTGEPYATLTAIDCESGQPEVVRPSFDFTKMKVYDYNSAGYANNLDIHLLTAGYYTMGDAVYGTDLYLYAFAKSMTSIIGTWVIDGSQNAGSIVSASIRYGNGSTNAISVLSGYVTIALDANGDYAVSYELQDEEGNVYTDINRAISVANTDSYTATTGDWEPYALQNECVTAALSASGIKTMTANLPHQDETGMPYFAQGIISRMVNTPAQLVQYGTGRFYISDDGSDTNSFYCYNTKWLGNSRFTEETSTIPQAGDTVIALGPVQNYLGTTPEMKYGYVYEYHPYVEPLYSAPVNLQPTTTNGYEWTFSWEGGDKPAPQYLIEVLYGSDTYHASYTTANNATVTLAISGAHTWRVSAADEADNVVATTTYPDTIYSSNVPDWNVQNLQVTTSGMVMSATWESPAKVFQAIVFDASDNELTREIINSKSYQWSAETAGTYYLYVRSVNEEMTYYLGNWVSKEFTFYAEDPTLYNPYNLQATPSYGALNLSWSANKGSNFVVTLSWTTEDTPQSQTFYTSSPSLSLNVSGFANVTVSWKVATCDEAGNLLSEWVDGPQCVMPENPYQLQNLQAATENGYDYTFTWGYSELKAAQYQIVIHDESGNQVINETTTETAYTHRFTQTGVYTWNVYATDGDGNSLGFASGNAFEVTSVPAYLLQNLQATTENGYEYTFTWEDSEKTAAWYRIYIYDASGELYSNDAITETTYTKRFTEAGIYTWSVYAVDDSENILGSADGSAFEVTSIVSYPLQNLQATTENGYEWTFTWEDSEKTAAEYQVVIYDANGEWYTSNTSTDTTYHRYFSEAGTYTWRVNALDDSWNVLGSADGSAFTVTPYPLQNLQATTENGYEYTFTWEDSKKTAAMYRIIIYDANGEWYTGNISTETTYNKRFTEAGTYTWSVNALDDSWNILGSADGNSFTVTSVPTYTYTITTTVPNGCDMNFAQGMWYYWWNNDVDLRGAVEAKRNDAGKYVATIETPAPYIGCLVANANPLTTSWDNLQQTYDAPNKIYGDVCLTIGIQGTSKWNIDERPCDEDLAQYLPKNLKTQTGVGSVTFTWEAEQHEQFEILLWQTDAPENVSQHIVRDPELGLVFNAYGVGNWQWCVRAISNNGAILSDFVEGEPFEVKENPYQPYDLTATTQDSATYYLSWKADVVAPKYYVQAGSFYGYYTTQPVTVTFDRAGDYGWQVRPCDEQGNAMGFVYGPTIHVPSHAVPDYSIRNLQVYTANDITTASWESEAQYFMVELWTEGSGWQRYGTTDKHYFQWENLSAGKYKADILPIDAEGNSLGIWTTCDFTIEEAPQPVPQYTIYINAGLIGGFVNDEINGTYDAGTPLELIATAKEGYRFVKWSDDNTEATRTLILTKDTFLTASFESIPQEKTYTLTVNTAEGGTTDPTGTTTYKDGAQVTIVAYANTGYTFTVWNLGNGQKSIDNPLFITMEKDMVITPVFTKDAPTPTYSLTVQAEGNGSITCTPQKERYDKGEIVTLEAVADEGWHFVQWSDNNKGAVRQITITKDETLTATFAKDTDPVYYTLNVQTIGQGNVTVSPEETHYQEGTQVTLTAIPEQGWRFARWENGSTNATRRITMTGNKSITATFEEIPEPNYYTLTVQTEGQGNVTLSPDKRQYEEGTTVTLTATPANGWQFVKWENGSTNSTRTVTMTQDMTVTATFEEIAEPNHYTLTVKTEGLGVVTKSPDQTTYEENTTVTLTAAPVNGWRFVKWENGSTNSTRTVTMTQDMTVTATFEEIAEPKYYTLTVATEGLGVVTKSPDQTTYEENTTVTLTAAPVNGWRFVKWENGSTNNTRTVTMTQDMTVTATFEEIAEPNYYTLTVKTVGSGVVTKSPDQTNYEENTIVTLTATPAEGWVFVKWEDGSTNNTRTVTMTQDMEVTATFEVITDNTIQNLNVAVTTTTATATWTSDAPCFEVFVTNKKGETQAADTISTKTFTFKKGKSGQTYTISVRPMDSDRKTYLEVAATKNFTLERLYTVFISAGTGGSVNEEVNGDYQYGEQITIIATPKDGYRFRKWDDGDTNATRQITITDDVYREASFQRIPSYTVTIYAAQGGTTDPAPDSYTQTEGEDMTITAIPDEGYVFTQWSINGEIVTTNPFVITAIATDYNIEPTFTKEEMGTEQNTLENTPDKFIRDGHLYIRRGKTVYDAQGHTVNL